MREKEWQRETEEDRESESEIQRMKRNLATFTCPTCVCEREGQRQRH